MPIQMKHDDFVTRPTIDVAKLSKDRKDWLEVFGNQWKPKRVMPGTCEACVWGGRDHVFGCEAHLPLTVYHYDDLARQHAAAIAAGDTSAMIRLGWQVLLPDGRSSRFLSEAEIAMIHRLAEVVVM